MKHRLFIILLILVPQLLAAQESIDSIRMTREKVFTGSEDVSLPSFSGQPSEDISDQPLLPQGEVIRLPDFSLKEEIRMPYNMNPSALFRGDYHTQGVLRQYSRGTFYGSGGQMSVPGIGRFNNASLGYQYAFNDKLSMQINMNAMKINMAHITGQTFSTSGALLYQPTERVTFKLFGSYDIGNSYGMSTHLYGGTMSVDMSDRFGMEMGVQRYYDSMRGRWETVPIVIPYYRFEKFTLGLDVGGLVFEILRDLVFDKHRGGGEREGGGPTIMPPPRMQIPIR